MMDTRLTIFPVIGERRLVSRDAPRKEFVVTLGTPRRTNDHQDWECPFRIKGPGVARREFGYGVDALQALTTALEGIRWVLDEVGQPLAWGGVHGFTGFQRMIPFVGPEITTRLERLVDGELKRHVRRLERRHQKWLSKAGASIGPNWPRRVTNRDRKVRGRRQAQ